MIARWTGDLIGLLERDRGPDPRCTAPGIICAEHCPWAASVDGGAPEAEEQGPHPLGSGFPVHQQRLGVIPQGPQSGTFHEPTRQLPWQRSRGELLQPAQARTDTAQSL